ASAAARASGRQPLDPPACAADAAVEDAVVQPVLASLPEFERLRHQAVAAPWRRARHGIGVLPREGGEAALERTAARHEGALRRGPGRELAAARPRSEIFIRFAR